MKYSLSVLALLTAVACAPVSAQAGAHCTKHASDYLGTDNQCHSAGSSVPHAGSSSASPVVSNDAAYQAFVAACNEQADKRKQLGLPGIAVITGGPGKPSTCHVEGGMTQTGAL